ncbi:MAG: YceI family protein [Roseivirga sp.]|nr:YceI family protein [Roseivirga sp.]
MQKLSLLFLVIFLSQFITKAQNQGNFYVIDTQHSTVDFKIRHIGFSNVRGKFMSYEGNIYFDPYDIEKTSASLVISTESLETGAGGRNSVLKQYFFEVEKYPYLIFTSTGVEQRDRLYLKGDLTIGGITNAVEIPFELISGPARDQWAHQRITLAGELTIDRKDYGIYYRGNDFWDKVVEDKVKIELEVGARVYNSLETVFPFRETSIGRMSFEGYQQNGLEGARAKMVEALADKEKFNVSYSQMVRGAGHLMQSGNTAGAIGLLELGLELREEMKDNWKSEFLARKAQYLLKLNKYKEARLTAQQSLKLDQNALAMEVLKQANISLSR